MGIAAMAADKKGSPVSGLPGDKRAELKHDAACFYLDEELLAIEKQADGEEFEARTLRQVAKKFDVNHSSLYRWCLDEAIKQPHKYCKSKVGAPAIKKRIDTDLLYLSRDILDYSWDEWKGEGIWDPPDQVHVDMVKWLNSTERFKLGEFPRGTYKTTIICVCFSIQLLCQNHENTLFIVAEPWRKAREILTEICGHLMGNQTLISLYGTFRPPKSNDEIRKWNRDLIYILQKQKIGKDPSILTGGIGADTTGKHPFWIFVDDVVNPDNAASYEAQEQIKKYLRLLIHLAGPRGHIVIDGTPWSHDDAYTYVQDKWGDKKDPTTHSNLFIKVIKDIENKDGSSIMPHKYSVEYIQHLKDICPVNEYASNYACDPSKHGNVLIDLSETDWEQIEYSVFPPQLTDFDVFIFLDPGKSEDPKKCYSGIVVGIPVGEYLLYIDDALELKEKPYDVIQHIMRLVQRPQYLDHIRQIGVESNSFQDIYRGSIHEELWRLADKTGHQAFKNIWVRGMPARENKDLRIYATEPFFRHKQIRVSAHCHPQFQYQVCNYPWIGKNRRDVLDAFASLFKILPPSFKVSAEAAITLDPMKPVVEEVNENSCRYVRQQVMGMMARRGLSHRVSKW